MIDSIFQAYTSGMNTVMLDIHVCILSIILIYTIILGLSILLKVLGVVNTHRHIEDDDHDD